MQVSGTEIVLRKKPPGDLLASAHAVEREFAVMSALYSTPVPVPRMLSLCNDASVVGTPFYLMQYVDGTLFLDASLPGLKPAQRQHVYTQMCGACLSEVGVKLCTVCTGNSG